MDVPPLGLGHPGRAGFHLAVGPRRPEILVGPPAVVLLPLMLLPPVVGAAIVPAVIRVDRVVPGMAALALEPRVDADAEVGVIVVVAKVVMAVTRIGEQVDRQNANVNGDGGRVGESRPGIDRPREIDRGKQHAAAIQRVVPVPGFEDVTTRGPAVVRRLPDPIGLVPQPIPWPPDVLVSAPVPAAGHPHAIGVGRGPWRLEVHGRGRGRQILDFLGPNRGPEAGHPLPPGRRHPPTTYMDIKASHPDVHPAALDWLDIGHLCPVAGHPIHGRRSGPPAGAHPDVAVPVGIPGPVARHPDEVVAPGPFGRGDFLNVGRRRQWHYQAGLDLKRNRLGEGLMHRAASQDLKLLLARHRRGLILRKQVSTRAAADVLAADQQDERADQSNRSIWRHGTDLLIRFAKRAPGAQSGAGHDPDAAGSRAGSSQQLPTRLRRHTTGQRPSP